MSADAWQSVGVSVQGVAHRESGTPCQDAHASKIRGDWLIAAVCDGAGSAPFAEIGATVGVQALVTALATATPSKNPASSSHRPTSASWRPVFTGAIEAARNAVGEALRDTSRADTEAEILALGHATCIAVVASPTHGVIAHIGDGLGAAVTPNGVIQSAPANGEFANETYFFTQSDWRQHLRLTVFDSPRAILLFSDGAATLATQPDGRLLPGFMDPLTAYLARVPQAEGETALRETLSHDRAQRLTGDDLTVFWASPPASSP